jgi:hypothetical protein
MTTLQRLEAIAQGRTRFFEEGPGLLSLQSDGELVRTEQFITLEALRRSEGVRPETAAEQVAAAIWAAGTYDPVREAVALESGRERIRVLVIRVEGTEEVEGLDFLGR